MIGYAIGYAHRPRSRSSGDLARATSFKRSKLGIIRSGHWLDRVERHYENSHLVTCKNDRNVLKKKKNPDVFY